MADGPDRARGDRTQRLPARTRRPARRGAGGTIALELELGLEGVDLRAIAAVNPVLPTVHPTNLANLDCPVQICVGSADRMVPPDRLRAFTDEMDAADVDWQLILYGGAEHAFHLPPVNADGSLSGGDAHELAVPGVGYHHVHAQRSWRAIPALLEESFSPESTHWRTT